MQEATENNFHAPCKASSLEDFFEDEANVPANKNIPYLLMLSADSIDGFDILTTHPYWQLCGQKLGGIRYINNKTNLQCQEVLWQFPLNSIGKEFVQKKEYKYCQTLMRDMAAQDERKREANVTQDNKLRFILCFKDENIRQKYVLTQDAFTLAELDGRNSEKKEADFYNLIGDKFNNNTLLMRTESLPDLHDNFAEVVVIPKGDYTLRPRLFSR